MSHYDEQYRGTYNLVKEENSKLREEPVAWMYEWVSKEDKEYTAVKVGKYPPEEEGFYGMKNIRPLYASPPKREPLTREEISYGFRTDHDVTNAQSYWAGVEYAEKMHGIGVDDETTG